MSIVITKIGRSIQHLFENAMMVALRNANVYFDIVRIHQAHLRHAADKLGSERILFGTDWSATWRWITSRPTSTPSGCGPWRPTG